MLHRLRGFALLACLTPLTLLACSGDDSGDDTPGAGGNGGVSTGGKGGTSAGGTAGTSATGGTSGASGTGGASGVAGSAGVAGASVGGSAGSAGTSGNSGQAGTGLPVGGNGGTSGASGAGQGGAAGTAGGAAGAAGAGQSGAAGAGAGGASGAGSSGASGQAGAGGSCKAPDVLILLDRTLTMHFDPDGVNPTDAPDYKSSKWSQAITAIEQMVSPPADATIRFGLELWPRDPGDGTCITLAERVTDSKQATNPLCEQGEIVVPVGENKGLSIQGLLDPTSTTICRTTPTGTALLTAEDYLEQNAEEGREQYVVLVTDGADWAGSCPEPAPLPIVQKLAAAGIKTFVVGFASDLTTGSGVGKTFLNDMACAGQTAKGFPGTCQKQGDGYVALDSDAAPIYLQAGNGGQLTAALQSIAGSLCCGCQAQACEPPDMLFALDRTMTMHFDPNGIDPTDAPDYKSSKWSQAIAGIEQLVAPPRDDLFRFGLELWPRDPGDGKCITQTERITGSKMASNTFCEQGEIPIAPALGQGTAIQEYLDPNTTKLCLSTPTGTALITASTYLTSNGLPGREQYVVLVTDGADWAGSCPTPDPLLITQQLAASGIKTFVVGFAADLATGTGVGKTFLNDMACAGQTALGFPGTCKLIDGGYVATKSDGPRLYLAAQNSAELAATLSKATDALGCKP